MLDTQPDLLRWNRLGEERATHAGVIDRTPGQVQMSEIGAAQIRITQIATGQFDLGQIRVAHVGAAQIRDRLAVIQPFVRWVRSFSAREGNELIPALAKEQGLQTMVGLWIDDDLEKNEEELANGIEVAKAGYADILGVGNEVLLRGDLSEDELVDYLERAKAACPGVDVGYVDAYYEFVTHPRVADACDVILANCYPFWEGCPADFALPYMKEMYRQALGADVLHDGELLFGRHHEVIAGGVGIDHTV